MDDINWFYQIKNHYRIKMLKLDNAQIENFIAKSNW